MTAPGQNPAHRRRGPRPDDPDLADSFADRRGAYVHIPFCARVCPYCDFAVVEGKDDRIEGYIDAVVGEIEHEAPWEPIDAVFVGGGTPTHIPPDHIARILAALDRRFSIVDGAEVTIEANPEDWSVALASNLAAAGVTRVSFGAQSFHGPTLEYLGRRHDAAQVDRAVVVARAAGFDSISLDLIFGAPGEPPEAWAETLRRAITAAPDHISAYALTVERGTPLGRAVNAGAAAPDEDEQADAYETAVALLGEAGYVHYEVSNWAQPGHVCWYNMVAWAQGDYLAFGAGAHRHVHGRRSWNVRRFDAYLQRPSAELVASSESLDPDARERERIALGLRRRAGVTPGSLGRRWMSTVEFSRLQAAGIVDVVDERIVVVDPLRTDTAARSVASLRPSMSATPPNMEA